MREIKFRQWNAKHKRFHYWGFLNGPGDFTGLVDLICDNEQFTGLRDKEGREIYENDVVKFSVFERFREMESEEIKVVKWVDGIPGGWSPFHLHTVVEDGFYNYEIESPQVIGNIHENPELLEVSK